MKGFLENVFTYFLVACWIVALIGTSVGVAVWSVRWVLRLFGVIV